MAKPFMTYEQQLEKLRSKNLLITDENAAIDILHRYGYFALISGYKDLLKNPTTKNYKDNTTIDDIVAVYHFDEQLRNLTLYYLLHVERHIRSALSYSFCSIFGEAQAAYLLPQNYDISTRKKSSAVAKLIDEYLKPRVIKHSDYPYIEHQKQQHRNVPLWALINTLTFGTLSKMYEFSKPQVQTAVSKEFVGINERQLQKLLKVLTDFRNVCAHNERLFTYRCAKHDIPDLLLHQKLDIRKNGQEYIYGKRDYFSLLLSLRYLIPNKEFMAYKQELSKLIDNLCFATDKITYVELLEKLGFPENWKKVTAYKKV